jgi:hypothetical protein
MGTEAMNTYLCRARDGLFSADEMRKFLDLANGCPQPLTSVRTYRHILTQCQGCGARRVEVRHGMPCCAYCGGLMPGAEHDRIDLTSLDSSSQETVRLTRMVGNRVEHRDVPLDEVVGYQWPEYNVPQPQAQRR